MLSGIVLTGWSRYSHFLPLCELLPVSIPTLIGEAIYLKYWNSNITSSLMEDKILVIFKILFKVF